MAENRRPARKPQQKRDWKRPAEQQRPRTAEQAVYDGPELPADITGKELDRSVSAQLKGLPEKLAARVGRHLAAAGLLIDEDPEAAYQHAKAARSRAPRLAVVREALGEAAYAAGHYAEALAELRAAKRMNGATAYTPIMADCHRALGQPEQAIKLARNPSVEGFEPAAKAEMTIVEAGARRDMGQFDAALRTLELAPLNSKSRSLMGGPPALCVRRHPRGRGPRQRCAGVVPPHPGDRQRRDHRRGHPGRAAREASVGRVSGPGSTRSRRPRLAGAPLEPLAEPEPHPVDDGDRALVAGDLAARWSLPGPNVWPSGLISSPQKASGSVVTDSDPLRHR